MTEKVVKVEKVGQYTCNVWKVATGSNTTYTWIDEDGIKRQTLIVSNRQVMVRQAATQDRLFIETRGVTLYIDDFVPIGVLEIEDRRFSYGYADSMFSGYMIDADSYAASGGEYIRVARWFN